MPDFEFTGSTGFGVTTSPITDPFFVPRFIIFELDENGNIINELVLQDRALPYPNLSFTGTMQTQFTWYPGNPQAVVQVLGAREESTSIHGMWKNRFINVRDTKTGKFTTSQPPAKFNDLPVIDPLALVLIVDQIRRRGNVLRMSWDQIVRYGFLVKFTHSWVRRTDVEWEMEFAWMSQEIPNKIREIVPPQDTTTTLTGFAAAVKTITNAINTVQNGIQIANNVLQTIRSSIATINGLIIKANDAIASGVEGVTSTVESLKSALSIVGLIETEARQNIQAIQSIYVANRQITIPFNIWSEANGNLSYSFYSTNVIQPMRQVVVTSARQRNQLAKNIAPEIIGSVVARDNQDLRDIATVFYGASDAWRNLAVYNGFDSSKLTAGTVVLIPSPSAVPSGAATDRYFQPGPTVASS